MNQKQLVACIKRAEANGFHSAWVAEGHGGDAFAILAAAAVQTSTIRLGTAIVSVHVRSAPTMALAAATLACLSDGRFVLGLGSSHKVQVEGEHGIPYDRPVIRLKEVIEIVRTLLRDGYVSYKGEVYTIKAFDFSFPLPKAHVPIYLAALSPSTLQLAGEVADGVILAWQTLKSISDSRGQVGVGLERAGRSWGDFEVGSLIPCSVSNEREKARRAVTSLIAFYGGFFPRYNQMMAAAGFADEAAQIRAAWNKSDTSLATRLVSEEMVDSFAVAGTPTECVGKVERLRRAGLTLPMLSPAISLGEDGMANAVRILDAFGS